MALISSSIPNFVNGVSQQPFTLRLNSQGEIQENGLSTVAQGLKKRPPTQHVKKISSTPISDAYIHTINRDLSEQYEVVITNGDLKVYDLSGVEKTVAFPDGKTYLNSAAPSSSFAAYTVADYTFIVNKGVVVTKSTTLTPTRPYEALVAVKQGNYGKTYRILIDGFTRATYTTPDGSSASHTANISTDAIASALVSNYLTNPINGLTLSRSGSTLRFTTTTSDPVVTAEDGFNNNAMVVLQGVVQKFTDLPPTHTFDGFKVKVVNEPTSAFDDYWVEYETAEKGGVYQESVAPGISDGLIDSTMPHVLIREADGTFSFEVASWGKRKVGDVKSAPDPTFVGRTISDVFFYRNRLGFLADESISFSEASEFFNFYPTTVTTLLDSDRIDVSVSHTKVANLFHAVPFNKQLILFSEQTQFSVEDTDILTPKNIAVKVATEFPCSSKVKPVAVGKNVYFVADKGDWSVVREYFPDVNNYGYDSTDVTGHLPKYIPANISKVTAAANEDMIVVLSKNDPSSLYVYKYFFANNEKLQSAWSKWNFGSNATILNVDFILSELFILLSRPDGLYLEKINVSLGHIPAGEEFNVLLDRKVQVAPAGLSYDSGYTVINNTTLGYTPSTGTYKAVIIGGTGFKEGTVLDVTWNGTNARILGNYSTATISFGQTYNFLYQLSTVTVKTPAPGGGQKSDTEGRLQLRKMAFNYSDSGYYQVQVTPQGRSTYTYTYSGKVLGATGGTIGTLNVGSGRFSVPVVGRNTTTTIVLKNDSPLPSTFLSGDWEGYYVKRSQPV